jgi:transcriptional regulator with XRE-family HTH domain
MLPTEFTACLNKLQLKQSHFAAILGVEPKTVWRWKTGDRPIPSYAENILYILLELPPQFSSRYARQGFTQPVFTPSEILGVPATATAREARSSWLKLCDQVHPDKGGCVEEMQRLNGAYECFKGKG